jgi:hypothetical protein
VGLWYVKSFLPFNPRCSHILNSLQAIQAFNLDESYYTEDEWAAIISGYSTAGRIADRISDGIAEENFFDVLAATSRLFQRTRTTLSQRPVSQQHIEQLMSCASDLHQDVAKQLSELSGRLDRARGFPETGIGIDAKKEKFNHGTYARSYGLTLTTQIAVNCILIALYGTCHDTTKRENACLCQEICSLGERDATYHMPLGSAWIIIALSVAYVGAYSAEDKMRVVTLLKTYSMDFSPNALDSQIHVLEMMGIYLTCGDLAERETLAEVTTA